MGWSLISCIFVGTLFDRSGLGSTSAAAAKPAKNH
jgi:hypothetical protein